MEQQCIACNNPDSAAHMVTKDYNYRVDGKDFALRRCKKCGLAWLERPPKSLGKYYREGVYWIHSPAKNPSGAKGAPIRIARLLVPAQNLWLGLLPSGKAVKILDVGCGDGTLMETMLEKNPLADVTGIEMRGHAADSAKKKGLRVIVGDFFEVEGELPSSGYDFIFMNHVFEHLRHPGLALGKFRRLLKKGGKAIIIVPNVNGMSCWVFGKYSECYDAPRHLFDFSTASLHALASKEGFTCKTSTFSASSVLASMANRFGVSRRDYCSWSGAHSPSWLAAVFLLAWLSLVPGWLGFGDQILAVLEK